MEQTHPHQHTAPAWPRLLLVLGDSIAFLAFAAIGRSSHGEAAGLAAGLEVAGTAAPFVLGWLLAAPWLGAFRTREADGAVVRPQALLRRTMLAWLAAWPLGLLLRALFLQRGIPLSFALVTFLANTVLLLGWRGLFAWLLARRG